MFLREMREYKDAVGEGEIAEEALRGRDWIIAYVNPAMAWPVTAQKVSFRGDDFWIVPITKDAYPAVAARVRGRRADDVRERISRFLSVLSWVEASGVLIKWFGGGSHLFPHKREGGRGWIIRDEFDLKYLPEITDPKSMLALALMREGRGLAHPAYSFLSFWRVLEVAVGRRNIKAWIAEVINRLRDHRGIEAVGKMKAGGITDLAHHLYVSGRCAIAHASSDPIVDPDQPEDTQRLSEELPLVEALAALAIEEKLGVKTSMTIYREHLYELSGFRKILGAELVEQIEGRRPITEERQLRLPVIDFGLSKRERVEALKGLVPLRVGIEDGRMRLEYGRTDGRVRVVFSLNFEEERLAFDIYNGIYGSKDDGSPEYAHAQAGIHEFAKWYFLNGCLEITDNETGEQIARKDAFIPENVIVRPEKFNEDIERWRSEAEQRRARIAAGAGAGEP